MLVRKASNIEGFHFFFFLSLHATARFFGGKKMENVDGKNLENQLLNEIPKPLKAGSHLAS